MNDSGSRQFCGRLKSAASTGVFSVTVRSVRVRIVRPWRTNSALYGTMMPLTLR